MTTPENTTNRDPLLHFLAARADPGSDRYITNMEAQGQREFVASEVIPTDIRGGTEESLIGLGFTLGPAVDGDPLFQYARLPAGWSKQSNGHGVWSDIIDEHGRKRCAVFYKAAFYDRRASLRIISLQSYAWSTCKDGQPLLLDGTWATLDALINVLKLLERQEAEEARYWRLSDHALSGEFEAQHEADRALFAIARAKVELMADEVAQ
ncbi:hypothetical protein [Kutzneria albida]|uniref:Uncharacterized protein n=1 Tax=Kutzneria albida DSM 43870 TaxID=1449976 RepID=W5WAY6_9PSEU|nr:hypothetical protein [Kutzneria albida]AHH98298.1 hypothetical protein KALB_4936 [Kutzneria albida DSM 43870]